MKLLRVGDKLIDRRRIDKTIDRIVEMRLSGHSQQEVADAIGVDRTFVSRLESVGEVRKGGRIAVIGFPILNKEEVRVAVEAEGVEFLLLLNEKERWEFVTDAPGAELFNQVMEWLAQLKQFDSVLFIGSDMRIELAEAVLGSQIVIGYELGKSPIESDCYVDVSTLLDTIRSLKV